MTTNNTTSPSLWEKYGQQTLVFVAFIFIARFISMILIPLNDSTEARYGEIARLMVSEHNWVSLMHYPQEYFWAKPPLSTWLSALSMKSLGIYAYAARLPAFLLSLLMLFLTGRMAYQQLGKAGALWSMAILSTLIFFILDAGTVMTDPSLLTTTVLVMVSFWQSLTPNSNALWRYMVFIGFGLSLLAKGPVAGIFTVLPLITWLTLTRSWRQCWERLPWIKGSMLTLAIALPWYVLAEIRTPGFLNYFIMGEHISRFLKPGWTGDLYGFAHAAPRGMIWVYFLIGSLPWSLVLIAGALSQRSLFNMPTTERAWVYYLSCFCIIPLLFFTFARNIIYPYVFPVLPAFALLVTHFLLKTTHEKKAFIFFKTTALIFGGAFLFAAFLFNMYPQKVSKSQNKMIAIWQSHQKAKEDLIYVREKPYYSAMFYSKGKTLATNDKAKLCAWLNKGPQFVVVNGRDEQQLARLIRAEHFPIVALLNQKSPDILYRIDSSPLFCKAWA